jgi:hypothetical protein
VHWFDADQLEALQLTPDVNRPGSHLIAAAQNIRALSADHRWRTYTALTVTITAVEAQPGRLVSPKLGGARWTATCLLGSDRMLIIMKG